MEFLSIEPLDVFCGRGNKLFGEAGSFGSVGMPPWPSVFAGAIRSRILADKKIAPVDLLLGNISKGIASVLGKGVPTGRTLESGDLEYAVRAGDFRISWVGLEREDEPLIQAPADLVAFDLYGAHQEEGDQTKMNLLSPGVLPKEVSSSYPLPMHPILRERGMGKLRRNLWISACALEAYLNGEAIEERNVLSDEALWTVEERVGIGMDPKARTVETGKLFTTEAIRLLPGVSFLVGVEGAGELLPKEGLLRLGGDGKGAVVRLFSGKKPNLHVDLKAIASKGRFKLVLLTPGLFANGWLPFGVNPDDFSLKWSAQGKRMTARLVAASLGRWEVVSGWDLAREQPKKAQRIVPAGGVYWLDETEGDVAEVLELIAKGGLWEVARELWDRDTNDEPVLLWRERRSEGFNNVLIGLWTRS